MLKGQRQAFIREELRKTGFVTLENLAAQMGSSYSTVRRDIDELAEAGALTRVHGGAVATSAPNTSYEPPFDVRRDLYDDEKSRIARVAHDLIRPNETILLSGGTTVLALAKTLKDISPLYIGTNDLISAMELSAAEGVDLMVFGGNLRKHHYSLNGYFTESMIRQIHADKVFIGVDAVDFNIGVMNFSAEEIQTKKDMIKASHQTIILCDHSKFERVAFINICQFSDVDTIITGKELCQDYAEKINELGVKLILA